jgi:hypothetical protein
MTGDRQVLASLNGIDLTFHGLILCLLQMEDERSAKLFLFIYGIKIVIPVLSLSFLWTRDILRP